MTKSTRTKPKLPRGRPGSTIEPLATQPATAPEFEREGMGVAPKE